MDEDQSGTSAEIISPETDAIDEILLTASENDGPLILEEEDMLAEGPGFEEDETNAETAFEAKNAENEAIIGNVSLQNEAPKKQDEQETRLETDDPAMETSSEEDEIIIFEDEVDELPAEQEAVPDLADESADVKPESDDVITLGDDLVLELTEEDVETLLAEEDALPNVSDSKTETESSDDSSQVISVEDDFVAVKNELDDLSPPEQAAAGETNALVETPPQENTPDMSPAKEASLSGEANAWDEINENITSETEEPETRPAEDGDQQMPPKVSEQANVEIGENEPSIEELMQGIIRKLEDGDADISIGEISPQKTEGLNGEMPAMAKSSPDEGIEPVEPPVLDEQPEIVETQGARKSLIERAAERTFIFEPLPETEAADDQPGEIGKAEPIEQEEIPAATTDVEPAAIAEDNEPDDIEPNDGQPINDQRESIESLLMPKAESGAEPDDEINLELDGENEDEFEASEDVEDEDEFEEDDEFELEEDTEEDIENEDEIESDVSGEAEPQTPAQLQDGLKQIIGYIKKEDANHNRSRDSLYNILTAIYEYHQTCKTSPNAFQELVKDHDLKIQSRAPFTPVLKICLGKDYDKTRLTEYAAALGIAEHMDINVDEFHDFIKEFPGGIKGCVKEMRAIRKDSGHAVSAGQKGPTIEEAREVLRNVPPIANFRLRKIIVGQHLDEFCLLLARRDGHAIEVLKILDDKYAKIEPILKRTAFIKGNLNEPK